MTSLETLQRTIDGAEAETQKTLDALAAAQDPAEVVLLRDKLRVMQERLGEFEKRMTLLREQQTLVLRSQASAENLSRNMDLADIREQVLSSNISVQEKAQILLHEKVAYDMSKKEWLELLIGVPADVRRQIGQLKLAGRAAETIGKTAVGQILDQNYKSQVCLTGPAQTRRRLADLPQQEIVGLGDFFKLQGAHTLVVQLRKRLLKLQKGFVQHAEFTRGLQLLRLVAAPGLGKSTALREIWAELYQSEADNDCLSQSGQDHQESTLSDRIRSSLCPSRTMVFVLDLSEPGLASLHYFEREVGQTHEAILAWRMLYSSVAKDNWPLYSDFLEGMDPRLRQSLKPMDVLHFWKRVGGFAADEPWMVVFAVDEVGAAQPAPSSDQPSWLQHALSNFVHLRNMATTEPKMKCMPVCVTASTRASASSLGGTASRKSRVKDIHLFPLDVSQMQAVISNLVERVAGAPKMPSALPTRATKVLQLIGGNPRMLSQALCSMAGNHAVTQAFPAGSPSCWDWLVGDFNLVATMEQLCETMTSGKWNKWLADHPSVVNMVNQVVAHSVCRVPITRKSKVPGTEDQPTTWQDLENDGVVYIGGSGRDLASQGRGDSSISGTSSSLHACVAAPADPEPFSEGLEDPDIEQHLVCTPPLLMVAAYYSMPLHRDTLVWVPLLMDTWRMRELTIVSILVTKLLLWRAVLHQETVSLSALLGGVDVEGHDLCFCIPHANFKVYTVSNHDQLKDRVQLTEMLDNDPSKWAFLGQGNLGPGSWLLLKHKEQAISSSSSIAVICAESKTCEGEGMVQFEQLELHTKHKTFHIPGVHNVPLYVTDQHPPKRPRAAFSFIVPEGIGLIDKECAPAYYNASFALKLNSAMEINRSKF